MAMLQNSITDSVASTFFVLGPKTIFYHMAWKDLPIAPRVDFYFFELLNPKKFLNGERPHFKEYGPFEFRVSRHRRVSDWNQETVVFKEKYRFDLDTKASIDHSRTIQAINLSALGVGFDFVNKFKIKFMFPVVQKILMDVLEMFDERSVITTTAGSLIMGHLFEAVNIPLPDISELMSSYGEWTMRDQNMSLIDMINRNEFGPIELYRKKLGIHKMSEVKSVLNQNTYANYKSPCNMFGSIDPMHFGLRDQGETIALFLEQICRPLYFIKTRQVFYPLLYPLFI
ncbi:scavenger receptor class B-like protein [Sarcoptes scabiei]|uniref:Scavenger receptor class B-like protein n=1 Tax=Sarcoptes scabiei TaxID=52283 RepID=A0A132A5E3_SARSC|nr:scavenger receptor class B-like protein [Sarcoptes scabiei]